MAVGVDLEVEVAADGAGVAGCADGADALAGPDSVATLDRRRPGEVGVEVDPALALAVDLQVVAVEDGVVAAARHPAGRGGDERRAAGGDNVEALMRAAAAARGAELADRAPRRVRAVDREDVGEELRAARRPHPCRGRARPCRDNEEQGENEPCEGLCGERSGAEAAAQWCSITRSTMLYSFASSALMK